MKQAGKKLYRVFAFVMAFAIILSVSSVVFADNAQTSNEQSTSTSTAPDQASPGDATVTDGQTTTNTELNQEDGDAAITNKDNNMKNYLKKYADVKNTTTEVIFNSDNATVSKENAENGVTFEGKEKVTSLNETGYVDYKFNVTETAIYVLNMDYYAKQGRGSNVKIKLTVDGKLPYNEAAAVVLSRKWKDATDILQDFKGNDLTPKQEEVFGWQNFDIHNSSAYSSQPISFYLEAGEHTIRITDENESVAFGNIKLYGGPIVPTYEEALKSYNAQGLKPIENYTAKYQAEKTFEKSTQTVFPVYDRSSPLTEPYSASKIRRNTIGQTNWSTPGMWVDYQVDAPEDGLYALTIKFKQNLESSKASFRKIYVNGEVPYQELESIGFNYSEDWQNKTLADKDGNPYYVKLNKGTNIIKIEACIGKVGDVMQDVDALNFKLNEQYRRIIMVTSATPDSLRDYDLKTNVPDLMDNLNSYYGQLYDAADNYDKANGEKTTQSEDIRRIAKQVKDFCKDEDQIPQRLGSFKNNITAISTWLLTNKSQGLEVDYFMIHSKDAKIPKANKNFFQSIRHGWNQFMSSFREDYNSVSENADSKEAVNVWSSDGRDQVQVIKDLIDDEFTPDTHIPINLSLFQDDIIKPVLAGKGPDIMLGTSRSNPVNLACRGALEPLNQFEGFDDIKSRFSPQALVPYTYDGNVYGVPTKESFYMMFYRKDIFAELGVNPPNTWKDMMDLIPIFDRYNMVISLPYQTYSADAAAAGGLGSKDMFPVFLMQNGGKYYTDDQSKTAFDSNETLKAFTMWTDFYTKYKLPVQTDAISRFRTGECPLAILGFETCCTLDVQAPEIIGLWGMAEIPGVEQEDGSINRTVGTTGAASVMFSKTKNKENAWKFLDWWTGSEAQYGFGSGIENVLGPVARYSTSNLEAFNKLPWSTSELKLINLQRKSIQEVPEVPGSYYVSRCLDNAFRAVVNQNKNARESLDKQNQAINSELARKHEELMSRNKK